MHFCLVAYTSGQVDPKCRLKFTEERFIRNKKAAFLPFTCRGTLKTFNNFKIVIFGLQPQFFASIAIGVE